MTFSRYEAYYGQLDNILVGIQEKQDYNCLSKAFGHWYLQTKYHLSDDEIGEILIDGFDDNGIDAYLLSEENNSLTLLQFKFPSSPDNVNKAVCQADAQKFLRGVDIVLAGETTAPSSEEFNQMLREINSATVFKITLEAVAFNAGLNDYARADYEDYKGRFENQSGSEMEIAEVSRKEICNLFDKSQHSLNLKKTIPYRMGMPAYNVGEETDSFVCVMNAQDLIDAIGEDIVIINDENIRLFEGDTRINKNIKDTASCEDAQNFYFFNNGITLICDRYRNDATSSSLTVEGVSIVNGCQTVTCLHDLAKEGLLKKEVCLLARVIQTSDYDTRITITEALNSQNPIRDSYMLANHNSIRNLQKDLLDKGYFLDRQFSEYKNKSSRGVAVPENVTPLSLEPVIQYYVGYYNDEQAALAKRNKGALFSKEKADEILKDISGGKVILAWATHENISRVLTMYRKMRRNDSNDEFARFMHINQSDLLSDVHMYFFLNTADVLLLNSVSYLKRSEDNASLTDNECIRISIEIARDVIAEQYPDMPAASCTKNTEVFKAVRRQLGEIIVH